MINSWANYLFNKVNLPSSIRRRSDGSLTENPPLTESTNLTTVLTDGSDWILVEHLDNEMKETAQDETHTDFLSCGGVEKLDTSMSDKFFPSVRDECDEIDFPRSKNQLTDSSDLSEEPMGTLIEVPDIDPGMLSDASSQTEIVYSPSLKEKWFVTPRPCFTAAPGSECAKPVKSSSLEDLLIEHPSMSVYETRTRKNALSSQTRLALATPDFSSRESLSANNDLNYNSIMAVSNAGFDSRVELHNYESNSGAWAADSESSSMNNSFTEPSSIAGESGGRADNQLLVPPALGSSPRRKNRKSGIGKVQSSLSRAAMDRRNRCHSDNMTIKHKYTSKCQFNSSTHGGNHR